MRVSQWDHRLQTCWLRDGRNRRARKWTLHCACLSRVSPWVGLILYAFCRTRGGLPSCPNSWTCRPHLAIHSARGWVCSVPCNTNHRTRSIYSNDDHWPISSAGVLPSCKISEQAMVGFGNPDHVDVQHTSFLMSPVSINSWFSRDHLKLTCRCSAQSLRLRQMWECAALSKMMWVSTCPLAHFLTYFPLSAHAHCRSHGVQQPPTLSMMDLL